VYMMSEKGGPPIKLLSFYWFTFMAKYALVAVLRSSVVRPVLSTDCDRHAT